MNYCLPAMLAFVVIGSLQLFTCDVKRKVLLPKDVLYALLNAFKLLDFGECVCVCFM